VQQRRARDRQVGDPPGADQIAEIDHALQLPLALRIALPDHVVIGDVHVNGLHRQLVHQRLQVPLGLFGRFGDQRSLRVIGNHRQQMGDQGLGVTGVPLQRAFKARMVETGQRLVHLTTQSPETRHHRAGQVVQVRERLALNVFEQTHMHRLPRDLK